MPTCQTCNYDSPAGAKFCRQCGAPLFAETDVSGADTRNYGRQEAAPAVSAPLPPNTPSVVDAFGSNTSRYYQPPVGAVAGTASLGGARPMVVTPAYVPPISNTTRLKGKWKRRLLKVAAYLALLIGAAGIGAAINEESHDDRPRSVMTLSPEDRNRIEIGRRVEGILGATDETLRDSQERAKRLLEKHLQSIHEARDTARRLAESRNTASLTEIIPVDLSPFEYQNATVGNYVRIPGHELLVQQTKDSFAAINQFYQRKLGKPLFANNEENRSRLIFQSSGSPSVVVKIAESEQRDDQWEITILRSPFPFSRPDEVLAAAASAATEGQAGDKPAVRGDPRPVAKPAAPAQNPKKPE
jgi:hypothetical protein